jgi:predicted acetyltransferase
MRFRQAQEEDAPRVGALVAEAFQRGRPVDDKPLGMTDRYVVVEDDVVVGTAAATPVGQYVGGVALPMAAIWSVAVSDTARGHGVGRTLMSELLGSLRDQGVVLSALFPSVPAPYRRVGYEIAGERRVLRAPLHSLPAVRDALPVRAWDDSDLDAVVACYEQFAATQTGLLQRPRSWWEARVVKDRGGSLLYRRAVEQDGRLTGYLLYSKGEAPADLPYYYDVTVHDLAWTTPQAGDALLGYLGSHRALGRDVRWPAAAADAWTTQFGGYLPRVDFSYPWMLRLLDPVAALEGRGYRAAVSATVAVTVTDPVLAPAEQSIEVQVEGGVGKVRPVDRAAARLDVGALAALYSGWSTATDLARAGRLTGAGDSELAALDAVFSGPRPWMADMF